MGRTVRDGLRLTAEQEQFVEVAREFAAREIRPRGRAVDEADTESPLDVWEKASALGLTSFMLPEKFGGGGVTDLLTQVLVQQELCHGDIGIGNLVTSNGFFGAPVEHLGTPEQQDRFLSPLGNACPPLTAVAVTEPGSGSDAAGIRTSARREGNEYVLNGQKTWISNAPYAEMFVIFATVDPSLRSRGVTAFVVPRSAAGLTVGPPFRKMGQRAIVNAEVFLDDVRVPVEDRLGEEGQGFAGLMRTFDASRILIGAATTGLARAALDFATSYAAQRVQFGVPIIEHQAVAFRLADMATRVDTSHLLTVRAATLYDAGHAVTQEAAMAKLAGSENAMWCTHAAVQTLGGYGYSREHPVERWMRDAKLEEIEEGTSDIQRLIISRGLGER
ncbi:acyl-CoA dehydrogenase family protein [Lentzea flaviverrucosa]|uniref:Acyl-CoA dehydrogenase n=1 Tax=Lentzea flaviverrucosa TaxID=200379 RepID=A0A1H9FE36_9PSEU|nr:acyl-CoA dehydrogenase family protein [Lentzea flaviverrucosa]RDI35237.1 alkylation response protein AidB-like acyl-CoA dehydrogenase [Lentzea flaviverrucosa]SEQ35578.1 Acyl-CoA dehydrogenase [Lentzea flaviverrucosa]